MEKEERWEKGELGRPGSSLQPLDYPMDRAGISAAFKAGMFFIQMKLGLFGISNGSCWDEGRENQRDVQEPDPMGSWAGMSKGAGTRQGLGISGVWNGAGFGIQ